MGYVIDNSLKMEVGMSIELDVDDEVTQIVMAAERGDNDGVRKHYDEYKRLKRLRDIGYQMMVDGKLEKWDWKWMADKGCLCDMDWKWFKEELEKANISREEFYKKWKHGRVV